MNIETIKFKIDKSPARHFINKTREVAVMLPLIETAGGLCLIFEKRSANVAQPGDISFPGGHVEYGESYETAAIRETLEELCLDRDNIELLGKFSNLFTYFGTFAKVYICSITGKNFNDIEPDAGEVSRLHAVPLDKLLAAEPLIRKDKLFVDRDASFPYELIENGRDYRFHSAFEYSIFYNLDDIVIWGFTAKILKAFLDYLKED